MSNYHYILPIINLYKNQEPQYLHPADKNKGDPVFVVHEKRIIGTLEFGEIQKLTYENIYSNPELWFLMNKYDEYLTFSYKSAILNEVLEYDLWGFVLDF